jgi:SAM-dependent methyltransferase
LLTFYEVQISVYYRSSILGYMLVHSMLGSVHMAVSPAGSNRLRRSDYLYQPRQVEARLKRINAGRVLELGAGRGFNICYLARRFRHVRFVGIDITKWHLRLARLSSLCLDNVAFRDMSFDAMGFPPSEFDLIYDVESICHTRDAGQLLAAVFGLLKRGGVFLSFDGFRSATSRDKNTQDLSTAMRLTEISMAVNRFRSIDEWLQLAASAGFRLEGTADLSSRILPNLARFQRHALRFFDNRLLQQGLCAVVPRALLMNSIAALLMPTTVGLGGHRYMMIELRKPDFS